MKKLICMVMALVMVFGFTTIASAKDKKQTEEHKGVFETAGCALDDGCEFIGNGTVTVVTTVGDGICTAAEAVGTGVCIGANAVKTGFGTGVAAVGEGILTFGNWVLGK